MISKLITMFPMKESRHQSPSNDSKESIISLVPTAIGDIAVVNPVLTIEDIAKLTDKNFWDTVGIMSFREIRGLVSITTSDSEIEEVLKSRFNDVHFWHHMSEKTTRNVLDKIKANHPEIFDTVFSIDSILKSAAEDKVIIDQLRKEHGLTGNYKLDDSILLKVSEEYRQ